jgi:hypothetical protein
MKSGKYKKHMSKTIFEISLENHDLSLQSKVRHMCNFFLPEQFYNKIIDTAASCAGWPPADLSPQWHSPLKGVRCAAFFFKDINILTV